MWLVNVTVVACARDATSDILISWENCMRTFCSYKIIEWKHFYLMQTFLDNKFDHMKVIVQTSNNSHENVLRCERASLKTWERASALKTCALERHLVAPKNSTFAGLKPKAMEPVVCYLHNGFKCFGYWAASWAEPVSQKAESALSDPFSSLKVFHDSTTRSISIRIATSFEYSYTISIRIVNEKKCALQEQPLKALALEAWNY